METVQTIFHLIMILPTSKHRTIPIAILIFMSQLIFFISSSHLFFKVIFIDLENAFYTILQIAGTGYAIYSIISGYKQREALLELFAELDTIRNKCKNSIP